MTALIENFDCVFATVSYFWIGSLKTFNSIILFFSKDFLWLLHLYSFHQFLAHPLKVFVWYR